MTANARFNFSNTNIDSVIEFQSCIHLTSCMFSTAQPHGLDNTWSLMGNVQAEFSQTVHVAEAVMGTTFCTGVQCSKGPFVVHAHSVASNCLDIVGFNCLIQSKNLQSYMRKKNPCVKLTYMATAQQLSAQSNLRTILHSYHL